VLDSDPPVEPMTQQKTGQIRNAPPAANRTTPGQ
jgi:hypothetical protein